MKTTLSGSFPWVVFVSFCMSGALVSPAFAQSLEYIVRHADLIAQAHVSDIGSELDQYNSPIEVITLEIFDAVVGNIPESRIQLRIDRHVAPDGPLPAEFDKNERRDYMPLKYEMGMDGRRRQVGKVHRDRWNG